MGARKFRKALARLAKRVVALVLIAPGGLLVLLGAVGLAVAGDAFALGLLLVGGLLVCVGLAVWPPRYGRPYGVTRYPRPVGETIDPLDVVPPATHSRSELSVVDRGDWRQKPSAPGRTTHQAASDRPDRIRPHEWKQADVRGVIDGYMMTRPVKLSRPVRTPAGSRVTTVTVTVDVRFHFDHGELRIVDADLSKGLLLGGLRVNAATRSGEAFYLRRLDKGEKRNVLDALSREVNDNESYLRRCILRKVADHIRSARR